MNDPQLREIRYRKELWEELITAGGPQHVSPQLIKDLRLHIAQHGIWVDKTRTQELTEDGVGVTVAMRHAGRIYPDELSSDGILYHYPETGRSGHDQGEIDATKAAHRLRLPVFVIIASEHDAKLRTVRLGWVEDWDDQSRYFLVTFEEQRLDSTSSEAEEQCTPVFQEQLSLFGPVIKTKPGGQRFKFRVFKRYGTQCAVCQIRTRELLEATCIREGSDDPRCGLVLCALHRRAFELGLFAIAPSSLQITSRPGGPSIEQLSITVPSLNHLSRPPHPEVIAWHWERWSRDSDLSSAENYDLNTTIDQTPAAS